MDEMKITIWLTHNCNLNCVYCYEKNKSEEKMDYYTAKDVSDFILEYARRNNINVCYVTFHGGEPFLEYSLIRYFIDTLSANRDMQFLFSVTTNCTIVNDEVLYCLNKMQEVYISIDGEEDVHLRNRPMKNNYYNLLINNIDRIIDFGVTNINARMTVVPENLKCLENSLNYIFALNIPSVVCSLDMWNYIWSEKEIEEYKVITNQYKEKIGDDLFLYNSFDAAYSVKNDCMGGVNSIVVDSNGNLYPCITICGEEEFYIGNIYTGIERKWISKLCEYNNEWKLNKNCVSCDSKRLCSARRCVFLKKASSKLYENLCMIQKLA